MKDIVNYKNVTIYTGIDVHKKSWELKSVSDHVSLKQIHMTRPSVEKVKNYLTATYPNAKHICVYEAGFSGYWLQEELSKRGIRTLIVHPGDVPTTDKEKRTKSDKIDCNKLAMSLRSGQLSGIHIPPKSQQQARSIVRQRYQYAVDERRMKNRIKSHLSFYGIELEEVESNSYWSSHYINRLRQKAESLSDGVLLLHLDKLLAERKYVLQSTKNLRELSKSAAYERGVNLLRSIPGVGLLTAMVFLTEIGTDVSRFKSEDTYMSYIGFVPKIRSSGENAYYGRLSKRGNKRLRTALVLSAWMSIRNSGKMLKAYQEYKSKGKPSNVAIIKVARKLALIIKAMLRDGAMYKKE